MAKINKEPSKEFLNLINNLQPIDIKIDIDLHDISYSILETEYKRMVALKQIEDMYQEFDNEDDSIVFSCQTNAGGFGFSAVVVTKDQITIVREKNKNKDLFKLYSEPQTFTTKDGTGSISLGIK